MYELYDIPSPDSSKKVAHPIRSLEDGTTVCLEEEDLLKVDFFEISHACFNNTVAEQDDTVQGFKLQRLQTPDVGIFAASSSLLNSRSVPMVLYRRLQLEAVVSDGDEGRVWYDPRAPRAQYHNLHPLAVAGGSSRALWLLPSENSASGAEAGVLNVGFIVRFVPTKVSSRPDARDFTERD